MQQPNATTPMAPEQPANPIRVCKGPGCTHLIGRGRGPTAIYCSDRCNWRAQNAKKKLSRDAENPHRRTVHRLTQEESQLMNRRLRELCEAGVLGTEIPTILNNEFRLHWTFQTYFQRADCLDLHWTKTPRAGQPWAGAEDLPKDQRAACYEDPAYEARNRMFDRVICRECFAMLRDGGMDGKRGHLWLIHKMSEHQYHLRNPGAPLFTFQRLADQEGRDVNQLMDKFARKYVTPDLLAAADRDRKYEVHNDMTKYVICRVSRCGRKSVGSLKKHLARQHDITDVDAYRSEHNWAPIIARDAATKHAELLRKRNERLRELAEIGRQAGQTEASKGKKNRGLEKGATLGDTSARITVAASLDEEMTPAQMAPHLYPLQGVKENARHSATVFLGRNKAKIKLERLRLARLSERERNPQVEAANRTLHAKG